MKKKGQHEVREDLFVQVRLKFPRGVLFWDSAGFCVKVPGADLSSWHPVTGVYNDMASALEVAMAYGGSVT